MNQYIFYIRRDKVCDDNNNNNNNKSRYRYYTGIIQYSYTYMEYFYNLTHAYGARRAFVYNNKIKSFSICVFPLCISLYKDTKCSLSLDYHHRIWIYEIYVRTRTHTFMHLFLVDYYHLPYLIFIFIGRMRSWWKSDPHMRSYYATLVWMHSPL